MKETNNKYVAMFLDETSQKLFTMQEDIIKNLKIQLATNEELLFLERQRTLCLNKQINVLKQQLYKMGEND
jgi:hypothetical protein